MPPEVTGDPTTDVTIGGRTYTVSELRMGGHGQLQAFLNKLPAPPIPRQDFSGVVEALVPDPEILDRLDPEGRSKLVEQATQAANRLVASQLREARAEAQDWPPQVFSRAGLNALLTAEGGKAEFLYVLLRQHHPEFTRQSAREMFDRMRFSEFMEVYFLGFPSPGDEDPKAPGSDGGPFPSDGSDTPSP